MVGLPTGTLTFLFSDVEGSTALLEQLGDAYAGELLGHRAIVRDAVQAHGGEIVDQHGEEVFAVFVEMSAAVDAAAAIQRGHSGRLMRVRIGLHTGEPAVTGDGYLGLDVHRAARALSGRRCKVADQRKLDASGPWLGMSENPYWGQGGFG